VTRQTKEIKGLILKDNCNVERISNKLHSIWRENCVGNGGLKDM